MSAELIQSFGRTVFVERPQGLGSYSEDNGKWIEPERQQIEIIASVQNLSAAEILMLPEGDRQKEWLKLYTLEKLQLQEEHSMTAADYVVVDGRRYMAMKRADYVSHTAMNITYYRVDVVLNNPKEGA